MRVEILGQERRRRWSDEQKRDIVMSVGREGATITKVARQNDVTRQQIYTWRHELSNRGLLLSDADKVFIRVDTPAMHEAAGVRDDVARVPAMIELRLNFGRSLHFDCCVDANVLTQFIRAVEAA